MSHSADAINHHHRCRHPTRSDRLGEFLNEQIKSFYPLLARLSLGQ